MNSQDWQEVMEKLSAAWSVSPIGSFSEMMSSKPIERTQKTKFYHIVYFVVYYPLRWAYLTWDAIKDAFNDAWERDYYE